MLELPEAITLARQIEETLRGRRCVSAVADHSPHKFAWYYGDPAEYGRRLSGRQVLGAEAHGGMVEIVLDGVRLVFGDGALLRYVAAGKKRPTNHQLLVELDDGGLQWLQMYGGSVLPRGSLTIRMRLPAGSQRRLAGSSMRATSPACSTTGAALRAPRPFWLRSKHPD